MDKEKISKHQLGLLLIGFLFGVAINPAAAARQDAWLAVIFAFCAALAVVFIYVYISLLNPEKTLIEILREYFGKYFGGAVGLLYVGYFIYLAAIVIRAYGDFVTIVIFPETPLTFIIISLSILTTFAVRKGLEVMARAAEIFVPFIPFEVIFVTILIFNTMDFQNWKPFLGHGIMPVLKTMQTIIGYPVGQVVIFLMIFPALNNRKKLIKTSMVSVCIAGLMILSINLRDIFALGADMFYRSTFPSAISSRLIPNVNLDPFYMVALLIGGSVKVTVCIYAAVKGISQIFNIDNYRLLVYPTVALVIALSIWIFDSFFELMQWSMDYYFYYSFFFQLFIPIILFVMSIMRKKVLK